MTTEYLVLGALLIVMGGVQTWLRHGPAGKALQAEQQALSKRRLENAADAGEGELDAATRAAKRSGKAWSSWTAILGGLSVVLGIVMVVLGVLGY
ncbi:MAG: hypothetical protein JW990_10435 [Thermoleophilia bacterium]|nr:hypothetical protein [Thermoleophilia bacterium]